jgi:hypothetical protein
MRDPMTEFLAIVTALPAAPFSVAAVLAVGWWALSLVGGVGDGGDGAELEVGGDVGDVGVGEVGEVGDVGDGDVDGDGLTGKLGDFLAFLGIGTVPITLWATLFSVWGWVAAFALGWASRHVVEAPVWLVAGGGTAVALAVGVVGARFTSAPLAPLFATQHGRERSSLLGEVAEVTTNRVDGRFGQGRVLIGGDDLVVQVRCDGATASLGRGSRALVVGYDQAREAYVVEPLDPARATELARSRSASAAASRRTDQREG